MGLTIVWRGSFIFPMGSEKGTEVRKIDDLPKDYLGIRLRYAVL